VVLLLFQCLFAAYDEFNFSLLLLLLWSKEKNIVWEDSHVYSEQERNTFNKTFNQRRSFVALNSPFFSSEMRYHTIV